MRVVSMIDAARILFLRKLLKRYTNYKKRHKKMNEIVIEEDEEEAFNIN